MIARILRALRRDRRGIALTEFAITLPVVLIVGLTGIEVANFAIANLRVSQIAMVTADNAGRVRTTIDEADINEIMIGARLVGKGIKFADNGRIILSDLEQSTTNSNRQWIRWQRCSGKKIASSTFGTPTTMAAATMTAMGPTGNQIKALSGTAVMFVEVVYDYQPIVLRRLLGARVISYTSAFNVRQRTDQVLKNAAGLAAAATAACTLYN